MCHYCADVRQTIEDRLDSSTNADRQFVWGLRYIDDLIVRDRDTTSNGTLDERIYSLQDANWNIVAICDESATALERYAYNAYGTPTSLNPTFTLQSTSNFDWKALYAGYRSETHSQLHHVRNRSLSSTLGNRLQRDPSGYRGSFPSLFEYVHSSSLSLVDPSGLELPMVLADFQWPQFENGQMTMSFQDAYNYYSGISHPILGHVRGNYDDRDVRRSFLKKGCIGVTCLFLGRGLGIGGPAKFFPDSFAHCFNELSEAVRERDRWKLYNNCKGKGCGIPRVFGYKFYETPVLEGQIPRSTTPGPLPQRIVWNDSTPINDADRGIFDYGYYDEQPVRGYPRTWKDLGLPLPWKPGTGYGSSEKFCNTTAVVDPTH